jgi:serine/threonine-protein kinase RsbW/stage II sporulation protein AB (anti-sigma F factor)
VQHTDIPYHRSWPATAANVSAARRDVLRHLDAAETPDPPLKDVALVVSEAMTNAVVHAYRDTEPGEIRVIVELHRDDIELIVEDDGRGLTPRPDSPGLGLGLPLIATVSDHFNTHTEPGVGTRLCVWFRREPEAATLH